MFKDPTINDTYISTSTILDDTSVTTSSPTSPGIANLLTSFGEKWNNFFASPTRHKSLEEFDKSKAKLIDPEETIRTTSAHFYSFEFTITSSNNADTSVSGEESTNNYRLPTDIPEA